MTLKQFFKKYGISQKEIARRADINPSLLRQYVRGIKMPTNIRLKRIEKAIHELGKELKKIEII